MSIERIKFRGKATKRFQILTEHDVFLRTIEFGQWVTTDDFIGAENTALANSDADRFAKFFEHVAVGLIDPTTVGQWTGLVSRGVEWYEGDIVEHVGKKYFILWHFNRWILRELLDNYEAPTYGGKMHEIDKTSIDAGFFKVIGNVHEVTK